MFLKRLELFGFKSFAERLDISFSNGITGIVGPNGSGKSNVSDAVRWVLGEQSAKQLRGANMADVIFKGTETRKALSYCEVSLVFDNTDRGLDIDYTEVVITRRLYRSGESEYYINRTGCRLKDVVTLFQDTGIGKEGYSIVGQGKIENILSGKQDERRAVFEEAAGIVKFRTRKEEAERKLAHTSENLIRINDIIDTLSDRIEPLGQQAETAQEYLGLREQLRGLEVNLYLLQNELAVQRRQTYNEQLTGIDEETNEKTAAAEAVALQNETLQQQLNEQEAQLAQLRQQLLEKTADNESMAGQKRVLEERLQNIEEQTQRIKEELENNEKRQQSMRDAINGDTGAEQEKEKTIAAMKTAMEQTEKELAVRDEELKKESEALEAVKAEMMANMNKLSDAKSGISRCETMKNSIAQRKERISLAMEQLRLQRAGIEEALADQKADTAEFDKQKEAIEQEKKERQTTWQRLFTKKDDLSQQLIKAGNEVNAAKSRLKVLEDLKRDFEGYNFSVKRLLSRGEQDAEFGSHICGVVAQLISVPEQFETAIESALGAAMQDVVTPSEEDAKALIEFLRRNDAGRATFLPLSAVRGRGLDEREKSLIREKGCYGAADELVSFDSRYEGIIKNLLGRTVITEDLDVGIAIARKTNHSLKIVTLKGDVMNAGGSMSGGSLKQKTSSILGREREIENLTKMIAERRKDIESTSEQVSILEQQCGEQEQGIADCDQKLHELDVRFARDFEKLNALRTDLANSENSENELKTEAEQLEDTLREVEADLQKITAMQGSVENSNSDAQADINKRQHAYNVKALEREKQAQKLTDQRVECAGLEKELDAMRSNAVRMEELIGNLELARIKLIGEGKRLEEQKAGTEKEIRENGTMTDTASEELQTLSQKEKDGELVREQLNNAIHENEEKRRRFEQEVYAAGEHRHKIEMALAKVDGDLSYLENRIWEEYELTAATAEEYRDPDFKQTGAQTEINRLKKAIAALGPVNVNAIEEYVETKEKFDDLSRQRDDLQKAQDDLNGIIAELIKKMDKQFKEQFEQINHYFTETFRELFGGGRAELKLENGENSLEADIEIVAQPPGKSLQLLSLLSGGERALTAIAILFAMLKLKPTPFCILDEIEAALDEANVGNFASYLRKFSQDTQFIVITHRKPTMEEADSLYGVAMEEKGVSKIVSVQLT